MLTTSLRSFLEGQKIKPELVNFISQVLAPSFVKIRKAIESSNGVYCGSINASGESQLKLDVIANDIMVEALRKSSLTHSFASEELETVVEVNKNSAFGVAFDPLDGSSLVDANFAVGTIFGVYPGGDFIGQTGRNQVAAGIVVYGPKTTLFLAIPDVGVHFFELINEDFIHQKGTLTIAPDSKYFAPGNARACADRGEYLDVISDWIKRGLTLRYSGGMVPDIAHILVKGSGIFAYPGYKAAPNGKLRLLFECNPISLLIECARGASTDGGMTILDKQIKEIHERTPIFCGSTNEVNEVAKKLKI